MFAKNTAKQRSFVMKIIQHLLGMMARIVYIGMSEKLYDNVRFTTKHLSVVVQSFERIKYFGI